MAFSWTAAFLPSGRSLVAWLCLLCGLILLGPPSTCLSPPGSFIPACSPQQPFKPQYLVTSVPVTPGGARVRETPHIASLTLHAERSPSPLDLKGPLQLCTWPGEGGEAVAVCSGSQSECAALQSAAGGVLWKPSCPPTRLIRVLLPTRTPSFAYCRALERPYLAGSGTPFHVSNPLKGGHILQVRGSHSCSRLGGTQGAAALPCALVSSNVIMALGGRG